MRTLVVIPTLNEADHIERVVQELRTGATTDARILVVDGGSSDGTPDIARALPGVEVLPNPGRLQSRTVNLAVEHAADVVHLLQVGQERAQVRQLRVVRVVEPGRDGHGVVRVEDV